MAARPAGGGVAIGRERFEAYWAAPVILYIDGAGWVCVNAGTGTTVLSANWPSPPKRLRSRKNAPGRRQSVVRQTRDLLGIRDTAQ